MTVIEEIAAERRRQIEVEGFTAEHDDGHPGEMAKAAATYALWATDWDGEVRNIWPWQISTFKPKDVRRDLIRAAALIVAEVERLDRAEGGQSNGR